MTFILIAIGHGLFVWFWATATGSKTGAIVVGILGILMAVATGNLCFGLYV
jgi:hypothetical protein